MLNAENTVGEWVASNWNTATIFDKYQIDFCCGGGVSLREVCGKNNLKVADVITELQESKPNANVIDPNSLEIPELVSYIIKEFHEEIRVQIPIIKSYLDKVVQAHGLNHEELIDIQKLFEEDSVDILFHLQKEEEVLFPIISQKDFDKTNSFILSPINQMELEHQQEGDRYNMIATLSNNFTAPDDACNSYKHLYHLLKHYVDRLHQHIHIENNILFYKLKNQLFH